MQERVLSLSYISGAASEAVTRVKAPERSAAGFSDIATAVGVVVATLLLLRLPPEYRDGLFVAAALFAFALALRNFTAIWVLFLAELPIIQLQSSLFDQSRISWTRFLLVGLTLVFLVSRKSPGFWKSLTKQLGFMGLALFLVANVLSAFRLLEIEAIARSLAYFEPALVFIMTYHAASTSPANSQRLLRAILIGGLFVVALGIVEFVTQKSVLDLLSITSSVTEDAQSFLLADRYGLGGRISSLFAQPVYAGMGFFAYGLIISFYLMIYKPNAPRIAKVVAVAGGLFLLFVTGSRGPVVALVPTLLAFVIFRRSKNLMSRTRNAVILLVVVGVFGYGLITLDLVPGVQEYWTKSFNLTSYESSGLAGRIDLTTTLVDVFKENPILGYGPGMVQKSALGGSAKFAGVAGLENHYAVILADGGLLAGSMYLLFMVGVFALLLKMQRLSPSPELKYYGLMSLLLFTFVFAGAASANFLAGPIIDIIIAVYAITVAGYDTWRHQPTGSSNMRR